VPGSDPNCSHFFEKSASKRSVKDSSRGEREPSAISMKTTGHLMSTNNQSGDNNFFRPAIAWLQQLNDGPTKDAAN
jgi:hypothetical protein